MYGLSVPSHSGFSPEKLLSFSLFHTFLPCLLSTELPLQSNKRFHISPPNGSHPATATHTTTIGLQQVQHSQLANQIKEDLTVVQQSIVVTLQNQMDSLAASVLQNLGGQYLMTALFLYRLIWLSTRNRQTIIREN